MEIKYIEGDLFGHPTDSPIVICHVANNRGRMGSGFVVPLAKKYPKARQDYIDLGNWMLGETQFVQVEENVIVANMIAQTLGGKRPLFYNHLANCMEQVAESLPKQIIAPLFSAGLAGGDWNFTSLLIEDCWLRRNIPVTVYYLAESLPSNWSPPE